MEFNKKQLEYMLFAVQRVQEQDTDAIKFKSHLQFQICDELERLHKEAVPEDPPDKAV